MKKRTNDKKPMIEMTDEQKAMFDALTRLQQEICINSLSGMNDIDSYKASSGKAGTVKAMEASVCQILGNHKVKAFLDSMKAAAVSDAIMTRDEALEILSKNARVKVSDIATFSFVRVGDDENGDPIMQTIWKMKDSEDIDPDVMACIRSVTMTKNGPKIELHDQQAAIKQLSTMLGWDAAQKINSTVTQVSYTADDYKKAQEDIESKFGELD